MFDVLGTIEERRDELMAEVNRLNDALAALGGTVSNGSAKRGRKPRASGRLPKAGTIGGKILAALKGGALSNAQIGDHIKLPEKKRAALSVTLNNLKKRGFVVSPSRGNWKATAAATP